MFDIEKIADAFQREKLAAIGMLAASVNHELKSPLFVTKATLESYLENAREGILKKDEIEKASQDAVEKSLGQVNRAFEIMLRLTDFARPKIGNEDFERVPLREVFERALELVNFQVAMDEIRLSRQIPPDSTVYGNRRQLEEIFFNLILNACQAMPGGGTLFLNAERKDDAVHVLIRDTGNGVRPTDRKRIFEPFYSTKGDKGTGLGLYVTKQLVERNGGQIWLESRMDQGTTFVVKLKAA